MDWPYIEIANNFIVDYHIVYIVVLIYCAVYKAGNVFGLDGFLKRPNFIRATPALSVIFG